MRNLHTLRQDIGSVKYTITIYHGVRCKFGAKCGGCSRMCIVQTTNDCGFYKSLIPTLFSKVKVMVVTAASFRHRWQFHEVIVHFTFLQRVCVNVRMVLLNCKKYEYAACLNVQLELKQTSGYSRVFCHFSFLTIWTHKGIDLICSSGSDVGRQPEQWMSPINLDRFRSTVEAAYYDHFGTRVFW
jgi:hypothetical protein